jgi:hypothetical protein
MSICLAAEAAVLFTTIQLLRCANIAVGSCLNTGNRWKQKHFTAARNKKTFRTQRIRKVFL